MALGDYAKTTWVNGGPPGISAGRLNNIENKTEELDTAVKTHGENTTIHITSDERTAWNAKETPEGAQAKVDAHVNNTLNPHLVTKDDVGLGNVDNEKQATKAEFDAHLAEKATLTKLGHVKAETDEDGHLITWTVLSNVTTEVDAAQIDIAVPDGYKQLRLVLSGLACTNYSANNHLLINFNDDKSSNYAYSFIEYANSYVGGLTQPSNAIFFFQAFTAGQADQNFSAIIEIENSNANKIKNLLAQASKKTNGLSMAGNWRNTTDLISKINISTSAYAMKPGAKIVLMGV